MKRIFSLGLGIALTSIACADNSSSDLNSVACTPKTEEIQTGMDSNELHPMLFSPETTGYIVKTKTKVLFPTGNPVRTYTVKGLEISVQKITDRSFSINLESSQNRSEIIEDVLNSYDVEYIEPDFRLEAAQSTTEVASRQWAHRVIKTYDAWKYTEGSEEVVVAVIDSGVDFDHSDLRGTEWKNPGEIANNGRDDDRNGLIDDIHGWDYVEKNPTATPSVNNSAAYHGTHVAGIIAGSKNTKQRVAGVAPRVKVMSLKFLDHEKSGLTSNAIKSIHYAINKNVRVINASWGSYNVSRSLQEAIQAAQNAGVLFVAASGNYGSNNNSKPFYPASYNYSNILSVTASTSSDKWLSGINYGNKTVDFAAPGSGILSTDRNNGYKSRSGSSMAAPYAAGIVALALSVNPTLSYQQMKAVLTDSADHLNSLKTRVINGNRVNAEKTVLTALGLSGSSSPSLPPVTDEETGGSRFDNDKELAAGFCETFNEGEG